MLAGRALQTAAATCRLYATAHGLRHVPVLPDMTIETFRKDAFEPATPALLPRGSFNAMPAVKRWFNKSSNSHSELNRSYLARFGATRVPLEISNHDHFTRTEQSFSFFLECVHASNSSYAIKPSRYFSAFTPGARTIRKRAKPNTFFSSTTLTAPTASVYLAQASLDALPRALRDDVPVPEIVRRGGKGDVYASSLWLGEAPTFTPLHRDPNPNVFVQLAGRKVVRLMRPEVGRAVFAKVQERIHGSALASMRGEEMMVGEEKRVLGEEVWGEESEYKGVMMEAELGSGDGLFIPKGWWHSVKGVGEGITGSVNWWFR